jgi:transposase
MNYYIKPSEWEQILSKLRSRKDIRTKDESKLRTFIEAIWYVFRSGCQWRLLPPYYGSWRALHDRFQAWSKKKIWDELFQSFHCESDMEYTMIDAMIVRAHACAAGLGKNTQEQEALGRRRIYKQNSCFS